jgi:penicillin-binding protein 1C
VQFGPAAPQPGGAGGGRQPLEAARQEWFLEGTQQPLFAIDSGAGGQDEAAASTKKIPRPPGREAGASAPGLGARITAPAPGTIIALDPDIPPARQRLQFTATGSGWLWRMDGRPLGRGVRVAWMPWPGRHVVQLTDAQGQVLDEVRIEVRGAGAVGPAPRTTAR